MTNYITLQELIDKYRASSFPQKPDGSIDEELLNNCIKSVSYRVDGVLKNAGVSFPISQDTIEELKHTVFSLTRYDVCLTTGMNELVKEEAQRQLDFLEKIRINEITLSTIQEQAGLYIIKLNYAG